MPLMLRVDIYSLPITTCVTMTTCKSVAMET